MALRVEAPPTLRCPRCGGPMFLQAADDLDYLCLLCGEYQFLVPPAEPLPPVEVFKPRRRGRPRRYGA